MSLLRVLAATLITVATFTGSSASAESAAPVEEGLVTLPKLPRMQALATVQWLPSGDALLVSGRAEGVGDAQQWRGYIAPPFFLVDTKTLVAAPLCRTHGARWLPGDRFLLQGYWPSDFPDPDKTAGAGGEYNTKPFAVIDRAGKLIKTLESGCSATPAPDGKRFLLSQEQSGRNNYGCYKRLVIDALEEAVVNLAPPLAEKPGRMVGFVQWHWLDDKRFAASVVDMDAAEANRAPPGMWRNVTPEWHLYDLEKKSWEKLAGAALEQALNPGIALYLGTGRVYLRKDQIAVGSGGNSATFAWKGFDPALAELRAASADGKRLLVHVSAREARFGAPSTGEAEGGDKPADIAPGVYLVDLAQKQPLKLELKHRAFWNPNFAASVFLTDGTVLLVDDDAPAAVSVDPTTGKTAPAPVRSFVWPKFVLSNWAIPREGGPVGGGRLALLTRRDHYVKEPHQIVVFPGRKEGYAIVAPAGFALGEYAWLTWSPDGLTLAVTEHNGLRVWLTHADTPAPEKKMDDF